MARRINDFYPTPAFATHALLRELLPHYPHYGHEVCWEPCVGKADIANVLLTHYSLKTFDIDEAMDPFLVADMTLETNWNFCNRPEFVITNPPFSCALPIVQHGVKAAKYAAAFLLRLSFLEPTADRGPWLAENPPTRLIVLPRISFTGDGKTDSVTCAWMIWDKRFCESKDVPSGIKVVGR